jgi:hypothetical protein
MTITTKLSEKDHTNASFTILWHRRTVKIIIAIFIFTCLFNFIATIGGQASIKEILPLIIMLGLISLVINFSIKKSYKSSNRISETITYNFKEDTYSITGESFNSELTWDKLQKVTLTKNWLLLWQTKITANAIPRRDVDDSILKNLKVILSKHKVSNNL